MRPSLTTGRILTSFCVDIPSEVLIVTGVTPFSDGDSTDNGVEYARTPPDGSHKLTQPQRGDTVDSVLRYVQFNPSDLLRAYREKIQRANLTPKQRESFLNELNAGLTGYTYLED